MARGKSGRVVLEIDPELKRALYLELAKKQKTLKEWFVAKAEYLVYNSNQANLFDNSVEDETRTPQRKKTKNRRN